LRSTPCLPHSNHASRLVAAWMRSGRDGRDWSSGSAIPIGPSFTTCGGPAPNGARSICAKSNLAPC